jgi:hypothetical protein
MGAFCDPIFGVACGWLVHSFHLYTAAVSELWLSQHLILSGQSLLFAVAASGYCSATANGRHFWQVAG